MSEHEQTLFPPPADVASSARISSMEQYRELYRESLDDPDAFWAREAGQLLWRKPWDRLLDWQPPFAKWFVGGQLNVSENCLDRHLKTRGDQTALLWEGEPGEVLAITYRQLHERVCRCASALTELGVQAGDRVILYLPMIPEAAVAMLACARIGAVHSVIFGGFSADAIRERTQDAGAETIITADGNFRRGQALPLKANVDSALAGLDQVKRVLVVRRTGSEISMQSGRDLWWHEVVDSASPDFPPPAFDANHPLFILYTSGSTGKPKGILHGSGGYLAGASLTTKYVFDLRDEDLYWCTADVGWITGHSYIVYGPLAQGATTLLYEGAPNQPAEDRFWDIIERHRVTVFYTAPTAVRAFMKWGRVHPQKHDLSSLRLLGSVGEPINPEAWHWYHQQIGGGRCPILDTWWQTETGAHMLTPLPGATPLKPGSATLPFFGVEADIVDEQGQPVPPHTRGLLVIRRPWPSLMQGLYGDAERYQEVYWSRFPGTYLAGDAATRDEDGYFWVIGRIDDVLNVSGHRLGTAEIESALVDHDAVAEAAVVGRPDEIKGESIVAFVILKGRYQDSPDLRAELRQHVAKVIGAIARPDEVRITPGLPKTRSGKIMRRLLKEITRTGEISGDVTTLDDPQIVDALLGRN
ncbi:MAG: acetate--CoA ligase [Verrucomicrobiota bacterium]